MLLRNYIAWMFCCGLAVMASGVAFSQTYPNKSIRFVTSEPGGGTDFAARLIAREVAGGLGQNVIIENRPSNLIGENVVRAAPDGYTLVVAANIFWIGPVLQKALYDPVSEFAPITSAVTSPSVVVVHSSLPVKSIKELIALAKAKPGALNYGSTGTGGTSHLGAELLKSMAAVNIVWIPYKGGGPAVTALVGGEVELMFASAGSVAPHMKSGRVRALAVTSAQPSALFPDLPTVAASGVPGYESVTSYGLFAPAKTPRAIIDRVNQEVVRVLGGAELKNQFLKAGVEPLGNSPEEFAATIKSEMDSVGKLVKEGAIRLN